MAVALLWLSFSFFLELRLSVRSELYQNNGYAFDIEGFRLILPLVKKCTI